jgi:hypothetical protein
MLKGTLALSMYVLTFVAVSGMASGGCSCCVNAPSLVREV